jgi:hypothetical protein
MRPETIEALTQAEFVRITPAQRELIARATPQERQLAGLAIAHAREAKRLLEELGVLKIPTVLDMTRDDVHRFARRADALRDAMRELDVGGFWPTHLSFGQALKVAPRAQARAAVRAVRRGGIREVDDLTMPE